MALNELDIDKKKNFKGRALTTCDWKYVQGKLCTAIDIVMHR